MNNTNQKIKSSIENMILYRALKMGFCLFLVLPIIGLFGCSSDFSKYTDRDNGFIVKYPAAWEKAENKSEGIAVTFESKISYDENDQRARLVVSSGKIPSGMNSAAFASFSEDVTKGYADSYTKISESSISTNGHDGTQIKYSAIIAGIETVYIQSFYVSNDTGYSVIVSAPKKHYDEIKDLTDKITKSFEIIK